MSTTIIRPKTREEWLAIRSTGIGSSEVGTILNLNPFETPYQLWRRKKGLDAPKEENFAMRAGHYLEDAVSLFFRDATGSTIINSSKGDWIIRDNERPYMQVSPDRTYWRQGDAHNAANKCILECKTTQLTVDADNIPSHWFAQVQYQLGVSGMYNASIAWLTQGREFGYEPIAYDADFFGWLSEEVEKFYRDYIIGDNVPDCTTVEDVMLHYPHQVDDKSLKASPELLEQLARLKDIKAAIKSSEDAKAELEAAIKMAMGDCEAVVDESSRKLCTWRAGKDSTRFDVDAFRSENPEMYNKYLRQVAGTRRFIIK